MTHGEGSTRAGPSRAGRIKPGARAYRRQFGMHYSICLEMISFFSYYSIQMIFLKVFYSNDLVAYAVLLSSANWRQWGVANPIMVGQDSCLLNDKDGFIWTFINYLLT